MIKQYIIDGNNLIGKIASIWELQKKDKQASREKLAIVVDGYFLRKKLNVTLHFDGHKNEAIKTTKARINYSGNKTADELIKNEIMNAANPRTICVVSSDHNIMEFARVCGCVVKKSENFASELSRKEDTEDEQKKIEGIDDNEIRKLFGVD